MKYTASSSSRRKALKVSVSTTLQKPVKVSISTALRQPSSDSEDDAGDIREEIKRRGRPKRSAKPPIVVLPPVKRPSRKPRPLSEQGPSASKEPNLSGQEKRHVNFGNVEVFRFAFAQGRDTVPTHGGVSLGMENTHHARHLFQQGEYAKYCKAEKRTKMCRWQAAQRVVKNARTSGRRKRKLAPKRQRSKKRKFVADKRVEQSTSSSEAEEDSLSASEEEEESSMFDQFHLLEPTRRVLLANCGVTIEENIANESLHVVETRARCGCRCDGQKCVPELCECALDGIQCQVDVLDESNPFNSYPCTCSAQSCGNPKGRVELDPLRIRNHFMQTLMRLKAAKKKGLDESGQVHSPQHIVFADADNDSADEKEKPNKPRIRSPHRRRGDAVSVSATPPKVATTNKKGGGPPRTTGKKQGRPRANCKKEVE
uniref:Cysteine/serine-rich nuclear protein N-terminal domain-containing protein n=1 Tax=Globodera rostochiensis TaxID=31243 RepID=A0A914I9R9_GLORO